MQRGGRFWVGVQCREHLYKQMAPILTNCNHNVNLKPKGYFSEIVQTFCICSKILMDEETRLIKIKYRFL